MPELDWKAWGALSRFGGAGVAGFLSARLRLHLRISTLSRTSCTYSRKTSTGPAPAPAPLLPVPPGGKQSAAADGCLRAARHPLSRRALGGECVRGSGAVSLLYRPRCRLTCLLPGLRLALILPCPALSA